MSSDDRPIFFDSMDGKEKATFAELYSYARRLFEVRPPKRYTMWRDHGCGEHITELTNDVTLHLCDNNLAKLKTYKPIKGRPFAAWLYTVAHSVIINAIRKRKFDRERSLDKRPDRGTEGNPGLTNEDSRIVEFLDECLEALTGTQHLLIKLRYYDGRDFHDIAKMLGEPYTNKKASDDTSYAKDKLEATMKKRNRALYEECKDMFDED